METVLAKCGFDCSRCPAFEANSRTSDDQERGAAIWERYFGLHLKPTVLRCRGCQAEAPWKTGNLLPDRACPIRPCAVHNGAITCAHCSSFPCAEYTRRVPGPGLRKEREAASGLAITDEEWQNFLEPYDGQTHLANLHAVVPRGELVAPRPPRAPAANPFPPDAAIEVHGLQLMKRVHSLLAQVLSKAGDTYAEQVLIDRQRPYVAGLLWVMAFHGRLLDGRLVLMGAEQRGRKECERLIRKSDNVPHLSIQKAMAALAESGIKVIFQPKGRDWALTLTLEESAGDAAVLGALKDYAKALVDKYGAPTYVNGYELKGRAFKAFKQVDMDVLRG